MANFRERLAIFQTAAATGGGAGARGSARGPPAPGPSELTHSAANHGGIRPTASPASPAAARPSPGVAASSAVPTAAARPLPSPIGPRPTAQPPNRRPAAPNRLPPSPARGPPRGRAAPILLLRRYHLSLRLNRRLLRPRPLLGLRLSVPTSPPLLPPILSVLRPLLPGSRLPCRASPVRISFRRVPHATQLRTMWLSLPCRPVRAPMPTAQAPLCMRLPLCRVLRCRLALLAWGCGLPRRAPPLTTMRSRT
jgi:hypothetical protein